MDPQKRHLKKLKRLQKLRKEKLKEKQLKKPLKKNKKTVKEMQVEDDTTVVNGDGAFTYVNYHDI